MKRILIYAVLFFVAFAYYFSSKEKLEEIDTRSLKTMRMQNGLAFDPRDGKVLSGILVERDDQHSQLMGFQYSQQLDNPRAYRLGRGKKRNAIYADFNIMGSGWRIIHFAFVGGLADLFSGVVPGSGGSKYSLGGAWD